MNHLVSLTYSEELTPILERYVDALIDGRIVGHKCPQCGRVYVPGKGYCPICVVPTTDKDEVEVSDHGTVTGFTIITPVAYYGQTETEPFVYASVLLDGSSGNLGGQDIVGVAARPSCTRACACGRCGSRRTSAAPRASPTAVGAASASVIDAFEWTGEPDADRVRLRGAHLLMAATDIAVVGFAQTPSVRSARARAKCSCSSRSSPRRSQRAGLDRREVGFTCAGSCDYLTGGPFAFVSNLEAAGAWPPISESHVEMDGAWALYEAWVRLQHGDIDTALVFGSGKSSPSKPDEMWAQQLDPYYLAPLGVDPASLAGIQARALLDAGKATERDFAEVVARNRRNAKDNPNAQVRGDFDGRRAARRRRTCARRCARTTSRRSPTARSRSCSAAATGRAALCERPAWIRGIDHRIEVHQPGHARPHVVAVDHAGGAQGRLRRRPARRRRAVVDVQPAGAHPARGARPRRRRQRQPVGRRARRQPGDGDRPRPHRRGRAAHRRRDRRAAGSRTRPAARCCSRTSCACWRVSDVMARAAARVSASARRTTRRRATTSRSRAWCARPRCARSRTPR